MSHFLKNQHTPQYFPVRIPHRIRADLQPRGRVSRQSGLLDSEAFLSGTVAPNPLWRLHYAVPILIQCRIVLDSPSDCCPRSRNRSRVPSANRRSDHCPRKCPYFLSEAGSETEIEYISSLRYFAGKMFASFTILSSGVSRCLLRLKTSSNSWNIRGILTGSRGSTSRNRGVDLG